MNFRLAIFVFYPVTVIVAALMPLLVMAVGAVMVLFHLALLEFCLARPRYTMKENHPKAYDYLYWPYILVSMFPWIVAMFFIWDVGYSNYIQGAEWAILTVLHVFSLNRFLKL